MIMIDRIVTFSVERRWFVLLLAFIATIIGGMALYRLPIDAVPDITNNQVQINITAPALSPFEAEKQVTWPIETALAGIPGLERTWSLSRNGFAQVTAVFSDSTDIYFARAQVAERMRGAESALPPSVKPQMGPIATGLGDIFQALPQGSCARQRFLGHKRNIGYATRFNRAIGSLSGWNSPAGSRLACSQR